MGKSIGDVLFEHLLGSPWRQCRLKQCATLSRGKHRVGLTGNMADMHQRQVRTAPVLQQLSDASFGARIVTRCMDALDALLHIENQQCWGFWRIGGAWMHFDRPWLLGDRKS